jgi:hypothetical protein
MSTKFIPPSDVEIDSLSDRMHYYELVRFFAWRSYQQAQEDMILTLQDMRNTKPWIPAPAIPLPKGEVES